jgi:hypothetical protein
MTKFQQTLSKDTETLWKIVKLYHPDMPNICRTNSGHADVKTQRMKTNLNYTWVCIDFRVRDYGSISISIQNSRHMMWGQISKQYMESQMHTVKFDSWRVCLDEVYKRTPKASDDSRELLSLKTAEILKEAGYKIIELDELYEYYYQD